MMRPAITTDRLNVFDITLIPSHLNTDRRVFIAFRNNDEQPTPVCTAVVMQPTATSLLTHPWIDWLETSSEHRRQGYATELLKAIESRIGPCHFEGATEAGEAFCVAIENALDGDAKQ